ncbi:uncharacterized protein L3040_006516 [Drepanopeziza brunnea f. sp. 'multigermtubi']|uniref:DUF7905 domain-containing protein n=1 Tax=Marssonina brunnea f. sp. multigermtubi (strain MB_m1) TaxID=1072389 RepID=K1X1Z3_MARBU|nr:uncharacterized protein MBM_02259 [Drepanopeziza brunnea f. sp. 'multigermtubi' MB_m1]EKD19022.1 hypothetical protein MBM_02259 [Drepanopeziza brunnea f. sp. 'multigermtubi' MB_m1]KAJ5038837.1 hypothetical protein L3040_006516 [Drepanopeziza brunnea f. sp. 'multigermtubi']
MDQRSLTASVAKSTMSDPRIAMVIQKRQAISSTLFFASEYHFWPEGIELLRNRLEAEFAPLNLKMEIYYMWIDNDSGFRVHCGRGEVAIVSKIFLKVMHSVIREAVATARQLNNEGLDSDDDDDDGEEEYDEIAPLNSKLVERLVVWKSTQSGSVDTGSATSHVIKPNGEDIVDQSSGVSSSHFPEYLKCYKFRQTWLSPEPVDDILPDEDLAELCRLTSCDVEKDHDYDYVYIGGHDVSLVRLASKKLDVILKHFSNLQGIFVDHLFYIENHKNIKLALKYFVDVRWSFFETTLLDNLHVSFIGDSDYEKLTHGVTVRAAPYSPAKGSWVPDKKMRLVPIPAGVIYAGAFTIPFIYNCKGDPEDNPMRHHPTETTEAPHVDSLASPPRLNDVPAPSTKAEAVDQWTQHLPVTVLTTDIASHAPQFPQSPPNGSGTVLASGRGQITEENRLAWDSYKEYSPEKAAMGAYIEKFAIQRKAPSVLQGGFNRVFEARQRLSISDESSAQPTGTQQQPSAPPGIQATSLQSTPDASCKGAQVSRSLDPLNTLVGSSQNTGALPNNLTDQNTPTQLRQQQSAHGPRPAAAPGQAYPLQSTQSLGAGFQQTPFGPGPVNVPLPRNTRRGTHLLDDDFSVADIPEFPLVEPNSNRSASGGQHQKEAEESIRDSSGRKFHQTMYQRAPKPKINPYANRLDGPDPLPRSSKSPCRSETSNHDTALDIEEYVSNSFQELLKGLQGYRGGITIQVEMGRIITASWHPKHVSDNTHECSHEVEPLRSLLLNPTEYGPKVYFTDVLTMEPAEVEYLLSLKNRSGQNLWETQVSKWVANYEFIFIDRKDPGNPFMIEVNAETFATRIQSRRGVANIYVHGTKRLWDFRITAIVRGNTRVLNEKYGKLAAAIESSLYIPSGLTKPYLSWQLDISLLNRFSLEDLSVHRVCHYNSADRKSVMKLSEFQSLDINGGIPAGQSFMVFEASPGPKCAPIEKLNTWYTASVSNPELDAVLAQNQSLELGDEAGWTPEEIANLEALQSMYIPAIEMLTQMDGVGRSSHNGSDFRSRKPGPQTADVPAETKPDVFWW